jgi:hypothetical protein
LILEEELQWQFLVVTTWNFLRYGGAFHTLSTRPEQRAKLPWLASSIAPRQQRLSVLTNHNFTFRKQGLYFQLYGRDLVAGIFF